MTATTVVVVLLALWQVLILLSQMQTTRAGRAIFGTRFGFLLPIWQVYLGGGHSIDYTLDYRDRLAGGAHGEWLSLPLVTRATGLASTFWSPRAWHDYAIGTLVGRVARQSERTGGDMARLKRGFAYRGLVQFLEALPAAKASARQFRITRRFGHVPLRDPQTVLESEFPLC